MKIQEIVEAFLLGKVVAAILWALVFVFSILGCAPRFPIGNDLYINKIKIESRECNFVNGIKLCSRENV